MIAKFDYLGYKNTAAKTHTRVFIAKWSKNTLRIALACSEAEINHFLCFGHMPFLTTHIRDVRHIRDGRVYDRTSSKHKKPFISAPGLARAILSVFLNHLSYEIFQKLFAIFDCLPISCRSSKKSSKKSSKYGVEALKKWFWMHFWTVCILRLMIAKAKTQLFCLFVLFCFCNFEVVP